jgi:hypothetical protein
MSTRYKICAPAKPTVYCSTLQECFAYCVELAQGTIATIYQRKNNYSRGYNWIPVGHGSNDRLIVKSMK